MKRSFGYLLCGTVLYGTAMLASAAAASAKDGEAVYTAKCKNCHGVDGAGNPAIGKMMNVTMKPLGAQTDAEMKAAVTAGRGQNEARRGRFREPMWTMSSLTSTL